MSKLLMPQGMCYSHYRNGSSTYRGALGALTLDHSCKLPELFLIG